MLFSNQLKGDQGTVRLEGVFTFETHPAFKPMVLNLLKQPGLKCITLDLEGVTRMDASSLGLLLILRETAEEASIQLAFLRPAPAVLSLIRSVGLDRVFEIKA